MTTTLYGSSDDLIEIEGDVREEFSHPEDDPCWVAFSDGTVVSVTYTGDGVWRIAPVHTGRCTLDVVQAVSADDDNYSDRATLSGETITWAMLGTDLAPKS